MERTKLLTIAVIGLLLLNLVTIGFLVLRPGKPGGRPEDGPPGGEGPSRIIIERLHFDDNQQERYQTLIEAHRAQTRELASQSVHLYRDYYGLLENDQPDTAQITSLNRQIGQNQREQAQLNFDHFNDIKQLCRPDQQAAFRQLVSELSRLFGRQQRPPRPSPDGQPEGPPANLPPRP
ncbi:periplasmic heavy metal sensor [Fibrella forsythiae]|uniref:Periplasmic heavy metal sensor n=1 Tax=Fibrella forsythiae TaxID=2817061 RepID=A0ABS3JCU2_9BACT|nr:periplasmic heavy metal sensor [Fibrella forsythiae]MBO0947816.1 periplasmic heavy metal sensor [Fibrella forsythiae]